VNYEILDSKTITGILSRHLFEKQHSPIAPNFQTIYMNECDVISVNKRNLTHEFEIKISLSDFKADFKKTQKHRLLKTGKGTVVHRGKKTNQISFQTCNYFYYVCPACLIHQDMIPSYAGLIWVHYDGRIDYKVKAPLIHSVPADENLLRKIAHNLTQKLFFGKSYVTLLMHEQKERVEIQKERLEEKFPEVKQRVLKTKPETKTTKEDNTVKKGRKISKKKKG
jgi:hypothetical protein